MLNYKIDAEIYSSNKRIVYRGKRISDNLPVIIKTTTDEYSDKNNIAKLQNEYDILKSIESSNIVKAYDIEEFNHRFALILEDKSDKNFVNLQEYMEKNKINLDLFFKIAKLVTISLQEIHAAHIIHGDINPSNILVHIEENNVNICVIDFHIATSLSQLQQSIISPEGLEGTLPYMAPEQTGRINRPIDKRADLYSLGATFYQILTGNYLFNASSPAEWIHGHIAKQPKSPHEINSDVPVVISNMIMKLLAKSPEERYSSAYSFLSDLEQVITLWGRTRTIDVFPLGEKDKAGVFQETHKLYGRETDIEKLIASCQRIRAGARQLMLVSGYSGVGKTSLVNELHKPLTNQNGIFASGKYDKLQQDVPYLGLIRAFQQLIGILLSNSNEKIEYWREKLNNALSPNGQLIIDVIPEIENLIGKQPAVPSLPSAESRNRFELVFIDFVCAFAGKNHPVIIYLDDFQWADLASMNLIKQIFRVGIIEYFLLIISYRDNEVKSGHPFLEMLKVLEKSEVPIETIQVDPLNIENVIHLVADTLSAQSEKIAPFAQLVFEKTRGNPFFINTFLKKVYDEKWLSFDLENGEWIWDLVKIQSMVVTENVTDIIIDNLAKLTQETQTSLKMAACIGNRFDLVTLSLLLNDAPSNVASQLLPALQVNLLIPLSDNYRYIQNNNESLQEEEVLYKFSHDRIHQALLSILVPEELEAINFKLSQLLINTLSASEKDEKIFKIVNYFNNCLESISRSLFRMEAVELYFRAGQKAKASVAYDSAIKYFENGIYILDFINKKEIENCYEFIFSSKMAYAECLHLAGKFGEAESVFSILIQHADNNLDKARVYILESLVYSTQIKREKAIESCVKGLTVLGGLDGTTVFPFYPNPLKILAIFLKIMWKIRNKSTKELLEGKSASTLKDKLILAFTSRLAENSYLDYPNLMALVGLKGLLYGLKHGYSEITAMHFQILGLILVTGFKKYDLAYKYGEEISVKLADKYDEARISAQVYFGVNLMINPWKLPYAKCLEGLDKAYNMGRQSGELLYTGYAASIVPAMMIVKGDKLEDVEEKMRHSTPIAEFTHNIDALCAIYTLRAVISALQNKKSFGVFNDQINAFLKNEMTYLHPMAHATCGILCLFTTYLFEDWGNVKKIINGVEKYLKLDAMKPLYLTPEFYFYSSLAYLSMYKEYNPWQRFKIKRKLYSNLKKFKEYAKNCPANFESKYEVIRGGLFQLTGKYKEAIKAYDKSIQSAKKHSLLLVEAVINEFIGRMFYNNDMQKQAKLYFQEAINLYKLWGSNVKVDQIMLSYAASFASYTNAFTTADKVFQGTHTISSTMSTTTDKLDLDLDSIMKSTQVIFSKVRLEELVTALLKIAIENAGATRGILILLQKDVLNVAARCDSPDAEPYILNNTPLSEYKDVCTSLIQFVSKTKKLVVLDNASITLPYSEDGYIRERKILSIICVPILREDKLLGMLYLENNLAPNSFTAKRSEVLTLLSGQAAISIENAKLYNAYDQFVPHEFLDILGKKSIIDIKLGDQIQKEMGVLFSDIRNFTSMSEKMTPAENFAFVNEYLRFMEPAIREHGGFVDKYIGDAIMALFAGDADDAVSAGIALQRLLEKYNIERQGKNKLPISIGAGVNYGNLMLGTVGGRHRIETTVISDTVNLTSRIESLTKVYGSRLLITDSAYKALKNPDQFHCRFIDKVQIRGKEGLTGIWEVYSADSETMFNAKLAISTQYNSGIEAFFNNDYKQALEFFQECAKKLPNDVVIKSYVEKCDKFMNK